MKLNILFILAVTVLLLVGCETPRSGDASTDAIEVLEATRNNLLTTPTHRYRFRSFWDNRFASSTYADSMEITYSYLPDSELGFGFHATGNDADILYNGKDELRIDHIKRKVVRTTAAEIGKDSAFFVNRMCFHGDPKALPTPVELDRITDTVIGGKPLYVYSISSSTPSVANPGKDIVATRIFYLDPERKVVERIRNVSHAEGDTLQVIDYFFSDYTFSDDYHEFGAADRKESLAYREVSKADDSKERQSGLIRPGDQLHRADYPDIHGEKQLIYGKAGKKTLVMFSFIGCGGCEYAMREMKKRNFAVRSEVDLVYSSPIDEPAALPVYLKKKDFPFNSFGKDSRMNDNFKVAEFPTFVLIDEQGGVERVIGGYDAEVEEILFK